VSTLLCVAWISDPEKWKTGFSENDHAQTKNVPLPGRFAIPKEYHT